MSSFAGFSSAVVASRRSAPPALAIKGEQSPLWAPSFSFSAAPDRSRRGESLPAGMGAGFTADIRNSGRSAPRWPTDTQSVTVYPSKFYIPPGISGDQQRPEGKFLGDTHTGNDLLYMRSYFGRSPLELSQGEVAQLRAVDRTAISKQQDTCLKGVLGGDHAFRAYVGEHGRSGRTKDRTGTVPLPPNYTPPHTLFRGGGSGRPNWTAGDASAFAVLMRKRAQQFQPAPQIIVGHPPAHEAVQLITNGRLVSALPSRQGGIKRAGDSFSAGAARPATAARTASSAAAAGSSGAPRFLGKNKRPRAADDEAQDATQSGGGNDDGGDTSDDNGAPARPRKCRRRCRQTATAVSCGEAGLASPSPTTNGSSTTTTRASRAARRAANTAAAATDAATNDQAAAAAAAAPPAPPSCWWTYARHFDFDRHWSTWRFPSPTPSPPTPPPPPPPPPRQQQQSLELRVVVGEEAGDGRGNPTPPVVQPPDDEAVIDPRLRDGAA